MIQIAVKFVQWDVPELEKLKDSKVYRLRELLNNGGKLNREEKNWITRNVWESVYFRRGIALSGYWKIQCKLPPKTKRFCPLVLK